MDDSKLFQESNLTAAATQGSHHRTIICEQLVQGCYAVTRMLFEPVILQMQGTELTTPTL